MEPSRPPPYNPHFSGVDAPMRHGPSHVESVSRRMKPQAPPPPYHSSDVGRGSTASIRHGSHDASRITPLPRTFAGGHHHDHRRVRPPLSNVFPHASSSERGDAAAAQDDPIGHRTARDVIPQPRPRITRRQLFDLETNAVECRSPTMPTSNSNNNSNNVGGDDIIGYRLRTHSLGRAGGRPRLSFDSIGRSRGRRELANLDWDNAPAPPPRRLAGEPITSPVKCLQRFSVYLDEEVLNSRLQVVLSVDVSQRGDILVIDGQQMLVHAFSDCGDRLHSPFRVVGVVGGCFVGDDCLVLATHRGLRICRVNGSEATDLAVGDVTGVKSYGLGFIAVQSLSLSIYRTITSAAPEKTIAKLRRSGIFKRSKSFVRIADVAITARRMLAVLDVGNGKDVIVYIADDTGLMLSKVSLSNGVVSMSTHLTVDRNNNFLLSDSEKKQLLHYSAKGDFIACLLDFSVQVRGVKVDGTPSPYGIAFGPMGQLAVAVCGAAVAEIRMYKL